MGLSRYFQTDNGSLPEIEVGFQRPEGIVSAVQLVFKLGAKDVTQGGAKIWLRKLEKEIPISGPSDALLVANNQADSYHFVVDGISKEDCIVPTLGIFVDPDAIVLDYRMGAEWTTARIAALMSLLRDFQKLGGKVSVKRWWGDQAQHEFDKAISVA